MTRIPRTLLGLVILLACPLFRVGTSLAASASHPAPVDDAVLLEESFEIEILSDSEAMVRYLNRTQVLTVAGAEAYGHPAIPYLPAVEIRAIRASNTPPSGKRLEVRKQMISDDSSFPSFELYSDSRQRVIHFPSVVPGSVLEYGYEQAVKNLAYLPHVFPFQEEIPARLKTLSVRYPSSYPLRAAALQGAPEPRREEKDGWVTLRWETRDLSPLRTEVGMPPIGDVSPAIRLFPERVSWGGQTLDLSSWDGIARWHWSLIRERLSPSAEVKQTAQGVVAAGSEPSAALRSLYEFTQKKIRYVAVELGLGSFQSHFNGEGL